MSAAVRCLLLLTVLLAGGAAVATADGAPETTRTVAADLLDTSWGDDYERPLQ
ncbi:hypothetical protein GCM10010222_34910 [Streptomyces tanashiensis]|uniref:Uncharacterized protein n=1 Tax=Streptomyces tanashiensis TaxID=67367 RepID=A0ABY6R7Y3_9ACTN|nr:hypothetical protein [Streptomyces tanashiensis]UZX25732.1 hypothetical protein LDH80_35800 [Streptomyces tanashiensis]GGS90319.1 hypothetical protein GCM10010222_34910 [Streptomyces tanashiensis]GGY10402.1 hypothetical protein GCM10010299_12890 [Streptomyces tanashiensis]